MQDSSVNHGTSRLSGVLTSIFCLTMIMGTGPGVLLVNRPEIIFGVPLVYAWAVFWYVVQIGVALIACLFVWNDRTDGATADSGAAS